MLKIILHDTRLDGQVEPSVGRVVTVNGATPLTRALQSVINVATMSPAELVIACHGFMSHSYDNASHEESRGGSGLQLCRENLRVSNVSSAAVLAGYFTRVWLMACGPAGTIIHSSRPFCRELAHYTDAVVIASDRSQIYNPGVYDSSRRESRRALRFGAWEGNVFQFLPDGTVQDFSRSESPLP